MSRSTAVWWQIKPPCLAKRFESAHAIALQLHIAITALKLIYDYNPIPYNPLTL